MRRLFCVNLVQHYASLFPIFLALPIELRSVFSSHTLSDLQIIFIYFCPSLFPSPLLYPTPFPVIFKLSHAITSPAFCPTSHSASPPLPSPPPVSLIVLFSAEGYSCLQGYENVRKAHSIFSYVNSHFPPEQTHFPVSDLPRCTSHFPPPFPLYLGTIVGG